MIKIPQLTTEAGAPIADNQRSQTAGMDGPVLLQDHALIEKLARFNRERIPERVVHAVGSGAHGYFEATTDEARRLTKIGRRTTSRTAPAVPRRAATPGRTPSRSRA